MKKILVTTISYVNDKRPGSEIYTTYAKRLINDVLTKTPYDIMVSTNRSDLFKEFDDVEMVCIKQVDLVDHKTHVGAFNQLLKFSALQCIDSEYDWVLYLDCDAGFTEPVDFNEIDRYLAFLDSKDLFFSTQGSLQRLLFLSSSSILSNFWQIVIPLISLYYRPQPYFIPFYVVHFDRYGGLGWFRFLIEMVRIAPNVCPLHLYR